MPTNKIDKDVYLIIYNISFFTNKSKKTNPIRG